MTGETELKTKGITLQRIKRIKIERERESPYPTRGWGQKASVNYKVPRLHPLVLLVVIVQK